jgi:hypothetical protein
MKTLFIMFITRPKRTMALLFKSLREKLK